MPPYEAQLFLVNIKQKELVHTHARTTVLITNTLN